MRCLFQRMWHSSVRFEEDAGEHFLVEVAYCGTDGEACARLLVEPATLLIREAVWEKYRAPEERVPSITKIPALAGVEAYFNSGDALREALAPLGDPCARELFAEAVRGVIQAETFLFKERGFSSPEAYQDNWDRLYVNSCRYYSNLDRVTRGWFEHIGYSHRRGNLFNRMKSQILYLQDNSNSYLLAGNLADSFHNASVELELEMDGKTVKSSKGELLRAPDSVCREASALMNALTGENFENLSKKDIARLLGGGNGCVHLIDLVSDARETIRLSKLF